MFMKNIYKMRISNGSARKNLSNYFNNNEVSHQEGFTLIEIVVTLLIVGILAAIGGMGIVQAVKGYITVKENSAITQKAQLAMSRINREIIEMIDIPADAGSNVLPITNTAGNRIIGQDGNTIKMAFDTITVGDVASGDILIDNVKELSFKYWSGDPGTGANATTWDTGDDIMSLYAIDVSLTLNSPNLTFTTRVNPRNNANLGGQTAPSLTSPPAGWGCFVATAAYGNPNHLMVQVLRDFRDNHLVNWPGGKWFVKQYYKHGPVIADLIRNKPVAMWAVRCFLAPFAAIAFCLMYAPLAIPLLFFVSLIITMAVFNAFRRKPRLNTGLFHSRGSILIGLIITMVIMAILAAAMVPLFTSSYMNQVYADHGRKAYYIAESGFRYAAYKYRSEANEDDKNDVLSSMDGSVSYVMDDAGSFTLKVYPFWFETNATTTAAADSVATKYYGLLPPEFTA
jgi:prepilin-type N-terminal cleavage/methylation domain-containing protein